MPRPDIDLARCPLCGRPNGCCQVGAESPIDCWCFEAVITPEALDAVPAEQRGQACLCAECARGERRDVR